MNLRKALAIAGVNLRRLTRDRTGAFFVFVFPFLIILAIGATFGGGFTPVVGIVSLERIAPSARISALGSRRPMASRSAVRRQGRAAHRGGAGARSKGGSCSPTGYDERAAGETVPVTAITRPTGAGQELQTTLGAVIDAQSVEIRAARFAVAEGIAADLDEAMTRTRPVAASVPRDRGDRPDGGRAPWSARSRRVRPRS